MAYVQAESSVMAASYTRDKSRVQPETPGKSQEEEAQIIQNHLSPAVNTFYIGT